MMKKLRKAIWLYFRYVSIHVKGTMQYKTSFFLTAFGQFLTSFTVFLGIFFMFQRFSKVEGFTYSEVLLCFSIFLMEFSLAEMFARGLDTFSSTVRWGRFDRILVRPQNEILQVLGSNFKMTQVGRILQAVVMFIYGITKSQVEWSFTKVLTVIFMLIGGTVVFSALLLIHAAFCFFTLEGLEFMNVFTDGAREYGKYPIGVYGEKLLLFTTFVIPYALIQYYPLLYLLGRRQELYLVFLPLVACWFIMPALAFWKFGVRRYKSSGS